MRASAFFLVVVSAVLPACSGFNEATQPTPFAAREGAPAKRIGWHSLKVEPKSLSLRLHSQRVTVTVTDGAPPYRVSQSHPDRLRLTPLSNHQSRSTFTATASVAGTGIISVTDSLGVIRKIPATVTH